MPQSPPKPRIDWGAEWKAFRCRYRLSQAELADLIGITRRSVQYTESGTHRPRVDVRGRFLTLKAKYTKEQDARRNAAHSAAA